MSYAIRFDSRFDADYAWLSRTHPELCDDLDDAILFCMRMASFPRRTGRMCWTIREATTTGIGSFILRVISMCLSCIGSVLTVP